jgi:hypothetical protein
MARGRRFFLVGLLAAAAIVTVYFATRPDTGAPLTPERLAAARARWTERAPRDYVLDVAVRGAQRGDYHVEVRAGEVVAMTSGGAPVDARAREYWTVDGMFRFLAEELSNLDRAQVVYGVTDADDVVLRAAFDPDTGYPARFLRHVLGKSAGIEWEVRLSPAR